MCAGRPDAPSDRLTPFLQGTVLGRTSVPLPTGVQFVEGRIVKKALVAATMAVGLLLASPGAAEACFTYCDWDPLVLVVTPSGPIVPGYDSVWTSSLPNLGVPLERHTATRVYD